MWCEKEYKKDTKDPQMGHFSCTPTVLPKELHVHLTSASQISKSIPFPHRGRSQKSSLIKCNQFFSLCPSAPECSPTSTMTMMQTKPQLPFCTFFFSNSNNNVDKGLSSHSTVRCYTGNLIATKIIIHSLCRTWMPLYIRWTSDFLCTHLILLLLLVYWLGFILFIQ